MPNILQPWVQNIPFMQQAVLISAMRAQDGCPKRHPMKDAVRMMRRGALVSSFSGKIFNDLYTNEGQGGSYSRPLESNQTARQVINAFIDSRDEMTHHYFTHFMHAAHIQAAHNPAPEMAAFFREIYERMAHALHLNPETDEQMNLRLGDNASQWMAREDISSNCSD